MSDIEDLYTPVDTNVKNSIINQMLFKHRNYIINKVKAPLMNALVAFGNSSFLGRIKLITNIARLIKRYPVPTKENTNYKNTHTTLDIIDKFFLLHKIKDRDPLFRAGYRLVVDEFEHDGHYGSVRDWWIEEIIKAILAGNWLPRPEGWPLQHYGTKSNSYSAKVWLEPEPYGGKYTIVAKMIEKRHEINKLLEEVSE